MLSRIGFGTIRVGFGASWIECDAFRKGVGAIWLGCGAIWIGVGAIRIGCGAIRVGFDAIRISHLPGGSFVPHLEPGHWPSEGDQIVLCNGLDLYLTSTDSDER